MAKAKSASKQKPPKSKKGKKEQSNREAIRATEKDRQAQTYDLTIDEHQRHLLMRPIDRLQVHDRTKPEKELLKMLGKLKSNKPSKNGGKKAKTPKGAKGQKRR